jgi:phage terminase large subunit GpA-like protein
MQTLEWKRLHWETQPTGPNLRPRVTAWRYICTQGCVIEERAKHEMIRRGQWRPTAASHDGRTAGFHLNALYSPVVDWLKLIHEWLDAQGSLEALKVFVNTNLAETWEIRGTGADMHELEKRQRFNHEILPAGVLYLTAGVDTQDDRVECSVWGWGLDDERWAVDHRIFRGDPSLPDSDPGSPWAHLREYLLEDWQHALGVTMRVHCALIDSGGHHTERVYEFSRKHELRRWHAIVGRGGIGKPLISTEHEVGPYRTKLFTVGVDTAKEDVFTSLRVKEPGAGYTHFADDLPGEFFQQLTSEKLVSTKRDFRTTMEWVKTSERNETLDCAVYARAAVAVRRPNFRKIYRNLFRQTEALRLQLEAAGRPAPRPEDETIGPAPNDVKDHIEGAENDVKIPLPPASTGPKKKPRKSIANQLRSALSRKW